MENYKTGILSRDTQQQDPDIQTTGVLRLFDEGVFQFSLYTLELENKQNATRVSRIPSGIYEVVTRRSKKFGLHFHIKEVTGRSWILIHVGNTYKDTSGCVLVGLQKDLDINKDNVPDIGQSKAALKKLLEWAPDGFILEIW